MTFSPQQPHSPLDVLEVAANQALPLVGGIEELARVHHSAVAFHVAGRDRSRVRVATTLLHGNEPSGSRAILRLLREGIDPAVDVVLVLGALEAATSYPLFGNRFLPGRLDRNRVFGPERHERGASGDPDYRFANALLELIAKLEPEALIDMHNNTGHNPAYGIATCAKADRLGLVSMFADRSIVTDLRLFTLMEAVDDDMPAVSLEVGRAGDEAADEVAYEGLLRYINAPVLEPLTTHMAIYSHPIRVELAAEATVAFAAHHVEGPSVVFSDEIDHHNFNVVPAGTQLGWINGPQWPLTCVDENGNDISRALFAVKDGVLLSRADLVPIMMTLDANVAVQDCLFYVVRDESALR